MKNATYILLILCFLATRSYGDEEASRFQSHAQTLNQELLDSINSSQEAMYEQDSCDHPISLTKAKAYLYQHHDEVLKHHKINMEDVKQRINGFYNEYFGSERLERLMMTKSMTKNISRDYTMTKSIFLGARHLSFRDRVTLDGIAQAYVDQMKESCSMCADERRIASKRKPLLQQIGYKGEPPCAPDSAQSPELVFLYENHDVEERGGIPTAKRGLFATLSKPDPSLLVLSEALSRDTEPVGQARLFNYFKLPIGNHLNDSGIPDQNIARLKGLDSDPLSAARTLEIAVQKVEENFAEPEPADHQRTKINREAFFEFVVKNKKVRAMLDRLALYAADNPNDKSDTILRTVIEAEFDRQGNVVSSSTPQSRFSKIFGTDPRLPMDNDLKTIWTSPDQRDFRTYLGKLANAFSEAQGTAANTIHMRLMFDKPDAPPVAFWNADYQDIVKSARNPNERIDKFKDVTFYYLLRTLLYMSINEIPEITTAETAGGLFRDWAFTENIESAVCAAQKHPEIKRIVVSLGRAHPTRIADFLKADGFGQSKVRYLDADVFTQGSIMGAINNPRIDHVEALQNAPGSYKDQCRLFAPAHHLDDSLIHTMLTRSPSRGQ